MNLLLFYSHERNGSSSVLVTGDRALRLYENSAPKVGDRIAIGEFDGAQGWGTVTEITSQGVSFEIGELAISPSPPKVDLICAVPRPQMVKRIVELGGALGFGKIVFLRSRYVEKSYLASHALCREALNHHLLLGMEQGRSTTRTEITVEDRFLPFVEDRLPEIIRSRSAAFVADVRSNARLWDLSNDGSCGQRGGVIIIGPERGFSEYELERFEAAGASRVSLGERILRVDSAVLYLVAQLEAVQNVLAPSSNRALAA